MVREIAAHKRVIFNGNGYAPQWVEEAARRGLPNLRTTVDALPCLLAEKNRTLFERHRVFTETELRSRFEIGLEAYVKVLTIEAETALTMARREILPAVMRYTGEIAAQARDIKGYAPALNAMPQEKLLTALTQGAARLSEDIDALQCAVDSRACAASMQDQAVYARDVILRGLNALRESADELETMVARDSWPIPTYAELLFDV